MNEDDKAGYLRTLYGIPLANLSLDDDVYNQAVKDACDLVRKQIEAGMELSAIHAAGNVYVQDVVNVLASNALPDAVLPRVAPAPAKPSLFQRGLSWLRTLLGVWLLLLFTCSTFTGVKVHLGAPVPVVLVVQQAQAQTTINSQNWDGASYGAGQYPTGWVSSNTAYFIIGGGLGAAATSYSLPNCLMFYDTGSGSAFYSVGYNAQDTNAGNVSSTYYYRYEKLNGGGTPGISGIFYFRSNTIAGESQSNGYRLQVSTGYGDGVSDGVRLDRITSGGSPAVNTGASGSAAPTQGTFVTSFAKQIFYKIHITAVGGHIQVEIQRPTYLADGTTANGGDNKWLTNTGVWATGEQNAIDYTDSSPLIGAGYYGFAVYSNGSYTPGCEFDSFTLTTASSAATAGTITPPTPASGAAGVASSNFTFTPNGPLTGPVTLSDGGAGGTFGGSNITSGNVLTYSGAQTGQTFTYTPPSSARGTITISATATGITIPSVSYGALYPATTYYVDNAGSDADTGLVGHAWQTASKITTNAALFAPGTIIKFTSGQTFTGSLSFTSSGTLSSPILITTTSTAKAILSCGTGQGVTLQNCQYITFRNFDVSGTTVTAPGTFGNATSIGLLVLSTNSATGPTWLNNVWVDNCAVHGFYDGITSYCQGGSVATYGAGNVAGVSVGYKNLRFTNLTSYNNAYYGISTHPISEITQGYCYQDLLVDHCTVYNIWGTSASGGSDAGNGIKCTGVKIGLEQYCVIHDCGAYSSTNGAGGGPAGSFPYICDSFVTQFCEVYNEHANSVDGDGFDIDAWCTNCVTQYCYSHDNDGPGLQVGDFVYGGTRFQNSNCSYRFCVSANNGKKTGAGLTAFGIPINAYFLCCTVYSDNAQKVSGATTMHVMEGDVFYNTPATFTNCVFYVKNGAVLCNQYTQSLTLINNLYYDPAGFTFQWGSTNYANLAAFQAIGQETYQGVTYGMVTSPLFQNTFPASTPGNAGLTAYDVSSSSPCINGGLDTLLLFGVDPGLTDYHRIPNRQNITSPDLPLGAISYPVGGYSVTGGGTTINVFSTFQPRRGR